MQYIHISDDDQPAPPKQQATIIKEIKEVDPIPARTAEDIVPATNLSQTIDVQTDGKVDAKVDQKSIKDIY